MKRSKIDIINRQNSILEFLQKNKYASVEEIAAEFKISIATARRDLAALKSDGEIKRFSGGAGLPDSAKVLPQFDDARYNMSNIPEKNAIAKCAAEMLSDGDTVFINSSSTALRIYQYITNKSVIAVTNNGRSLFLDRNPGTDLIILGGEVPNAQGNSYKKMSLTGEFTVANINRIAATKCILGVSGISVEGGLTSMAIQDPAVNRAMIQRCNGPVIVVADHRKIGVEHNFRFGKITDIHCLITDSKSNPQKLEEFRNLGIEVIIVEPLEE